MVRKHKIYSKNENWSNTFSTLLLTSNLFQLVEALTFNRVEEILVKETMICMGLKDSKVLLTEKGLTIYWS